MNPAPECEQVLLVQAELDGELDAAAAAALAAHRAQCPICQEAAAELAQARALIEAAPREALYATVPDDLRRRLEARIAAASPAAARPGRLPSQRARGWRQAWRRWWPAGAGFGVGAAAAASLALMLLLPAQPDLTEQVVAGHIRGLQAGHLHDVASTDRHTVKPWFNGKIDFAPPVKDLTAERFPLRGGRLDYLGGRPVAALVYQRAAHMIDLYVWPAGRDSDAAAATAPQSVEYNGYNVVHWVEDGMALWAVSDVEASQLREFVEDWRRAP